MLSFALIAFAIAGVQTAVTAPVTPQRAQPVVEVFARQYTPDGRATSSGGDPGSDVASGYVWSDAALCSIGAGDSAPKGSPAYGWHYVVRVVSRTETELNVQFEYSRIWGDKQGASGRSRLRLNERVELDRVTLPGPIACGAETFRLEMAMVVRAPSMRLGPGAGGRGGGGGSGGGASGIGAVGARAGGLGVNTGTRSSETDHDILRAKLEELAAAQRTAGGQARVKTLTDELMQLASRPPIEAEVWLVQKLPNGTESVQRRQLRFSLAAPFTFDPVVNGGVTIQVSGVLRMDPSSLSPLALEIRRRTRGDGPPPIDNEGGSVQNMPLPTADDVLSFELPPTREAGRTVPSAPEFSVRVKLIKLIEK